MTRSAFVTVDALGLLRQPTGSSRVQFLQAGVGASARSVQDVLRDAYRSGDFGADDTGATDATAALQALLDAAAGSGVAHITRGTYAIQCPSPASPVDSADDVVLDFPSDTFLVIDEGTTFVLDAGGSGRVKAFHIRDVSDVVILAGPGVTIQGDRASAATASSAFENAHGVNLEGATRVRISGLRCIDHYGDGFYVGAGTQGFCEDVELYQCEADNNRRQGLSVISVRGFRDVGGRYTGTTGTAPSCGVDIEPNAATEYLERIRFEHTYCQGNDGSGFFVFLQQLQNAARVVDITFEGCISEGNNVDGGSVGAQYDGFEVRRVVDTSAAPVPRGHVTFVDCVSVRDTYGGFNVQDKSRTGPRVRLIRPTVLSPNQSGATGSIQLSHGIKVYATGTSFTTDPGGVDIEDPLVLDPSGNLVAGQAALAFYGTSGARLSDVRVRRPHLELGGAGDPWNASNNAGWIEIEDGQRRQIDLGASDATILPRHLGRVVTNQSQIGGTRTFTLPSAAQAGVGCELEFLCLAAQILRIDPAGSEEVIPDGTGAGKYLQTSEVGARLRLRRLSATQWIILEEVGTWSREP